MHIAIDVTPLGNANSGRGVGSYTKLLVSALQKYERSHTYSLITRKQKVPDNVDIIHYPYFDPFFLTLPLLQTKPRVVTVHDLVPIHFPDKFPRGLRGELKWQIQRRALHTSRRVITDSYASKEDIEQYAGIPSLNIEVIHLAAPEQYARVQDKTVLQKVASKYNLPKQFLVYVGDVNWNKNIMGLLKAFQMFSRKNYDCHLVLVGKSFQDADLPEALEVRRFVQGAHLGNRVHLIGFVEQADLPDLYTLAAACVLPSFYEGFGLPVLEAMACGCPVVAARGSSLDEIAGPAIRVNPYSVDDLAGGMIEIVHLNSVKRQELLKQSIDWSARFSWHKVARETVLAYKKALE